MNGTLIVDLMCYNFKANYMNRFFLCVAFVCLFTSLHAQTLNGVVVDSSGESLPGATLYIHEISSGIMVDSDGRFQLKLKPGSYTFEVRLLGYDTHIQKFEMRDQTENIKIALNDKVYTLPEVVIVNNKEDYALRVMRNAIAYAPYHKHKVKSYLSEAYIKGSVKVDKIPGLMKNMKLEANDVTIRAGSLENKTFVLESNNEISFTKPNSYEQKVLAINSSIPKEFAVDAVFQVITDDIYDPSFGGFVSPLSPDAFRYYNFKFIDITGDNSLSINKIQVIPKRKNNELVSGYIYILEHTWDVYAAELQVNILGNIIDYTINYQQVKPLVHLPISYDIKANVSFMGLKANGIYHTSVKYKSVELDDIDKMKIDDRSNILVNTDNPDISPKQTRELEKIEELASKDNLTTKDAYKLANLMQKTIEPAEAKTERESLEIKSMGNIKMETDSAARDKDTLYWSEIRSLPLHIEEKSALEEAKLANSSFIPDSLKKQVRKSSLVGGLISGKRYKISDKLSMSHEGLIKAIKEYNFVDGFHIGNSVNFRYTEKKSILDIDLSGYYTTGREKLIWNAGLTYAYSPMNPGQLNVSVGQFSNDVSNDGMNRTINSLYSLLLGDSYKSFFNERYLTVSNSKYIANGLRLRVQGQLSEREVLQNHTSFNIANRTPDDNKSPSTNFDLDFPNHKAAFGEVGLYYTPKHRYRIRDGWKVYAGTRNPSLGINYKGGKYSGSQQNLSSFHQLEASVYQYVDLSIFSYIRYRVSGGFISGDTHLQDKKYHGLAPALATDKSFIDNYMLLGNYAHSSDYWVNAHLSYFSQYLFIKNLPFLQRFLFDEAIHVKGIMSDNTRIYWETGYSIGLRNEIRAGVFTSFNENKFDKIGLRVYVYLSPIKR